MLLAGPVARVPGGCLSAAGRAGAGSRSCHSQPRSPAARAPGPRRPAATAGYGSTGAGCRPVGLSPGLGSRASGPGGRPGCGYRTAACCQRVPASATPPYYCGCGTGGWLRPGRARPPGAAATVVRGVAGPGCGPAAAGQAGGLVATASPAAPAARCQGGRPAARARGPAAWAATWQASPGYGGPRDWPRATAPARYPRPRPGR